MKEYDEAFKQGTWLSRENGLGATPLLLSVFYTAESVKA